jgi:diguanylate cyclase (GGDEF)-like protein/PAS domain S-box-containing protein
MSLKKLINTKIDSINFDVTIQEVLDFMVLNKIKYAVLLKEQKAIGIITEKDILSLYTRNIELELSALDFCNTNLITSKYYRRINYVLGLMLNHNIRRVIITNENDLYIGSILQEDIIYKFEDDIFKSNIKIKELIEKNNKAIFVNKNSTIQTCIESLSKNDIGSILIFADSKPISILTESDIINFAQKHVDTNLKIENFIHLGITCFDSEDFLLDVIKVLKEKQIRRVVIFDKIENEYFIITTKDILKNIKGNYNTFLESKLKDAKKTFNSLNEAVIELFDNEDEQIIYWYNDKAYKLFDIKVDNNITTIIPEQKWKNIYEKIKANDIKEPLIVEINNNPFQLTIINSILSGNPIIKLFLTNITEISSINKQINSQFKLLYEEVPYPYQSLNNQGIITNINKRWLEVTGYNEEEVIGQKFSLFVDEPFEKLKNLFKLFLNGKHIENKRMKIKKKNGEIILGDFIGNISNINGEIKTHCIFKDITEDEKIERKLKLSDIVFENTTEGIVITNGKNKIISVNNSFSKITGYTREKIIGKNPKFLQSGKHDKLFYENLWKELSTNGQYQGEIWNRKKSGEIYPEWLNINVVKNSEGNIINYVAIFSDITKIKDSNEKIEFLAHHDVLTNLPNRLLLKTRIDQSIIHANNLNEILAVLFIDIDNFKIINDTYGHTIGDKIINLVASRLKRDLRKKDTISRIGGDEFIIVIEDINNIENIKKIALKILNDFKEPLKLEEYLFDVTISIGISLFPNNGLNAEDLIKQADTAMYSAKNAGKNQFHFYKDEMTSEIFEKIIMKQEIIDGLKNDEFEVYYQPQIDIQNNKIVGAEALIRWNYKKSRVIFPGEFISYAEESKLIIPIGEFVLKSACTFFKKLHDLKILEEGYIAVNISSVQIKNSDILKTITESLNYSKLNAKYLEVEVTESYIMDNIEKSISTLNNLKELGIKLAIDDFGTGYSSLSYLKRFPIDKLKIDKSFIDELPINLKDIAIAKTIIALGKGLGIKTIAEGVEKKVQKDFLKTEQCDEIQGWIYSKALKENDFINFVKNFK